MNKVQHAPQDSPQGFPCPQCGAILRSGIRELLTAGSLCCPNCSLKLVIDRDASRQALDILHRVVKAEGRSRSHPQNGL
jgi:transcription elongation factor Elf1